MNKTEIRLAGSGGQGVILASVIIAEAAVLSGEYAVQSQSYGPEARGGVCRAEVIVDDEEIDYPKVREADFLLALTQSSFDKYSVSAADDAVIIVDSDIDTTAYTATGKSVISAPILYTASDVLHKPMTANIVSLGVVNGTLHLFDNKTLMKAILMHVPKGTEEVNMKAFYAGLELTGNGEA